MTRDKITISGRCAIGSDGKDIPSRIVREHILGKDDHKYYGNTRAIDVITVQRSSGKDRSGEFKLFVSEHPGGDKGGGIIAELLDEYAKKFLKQQSYVYCSYDSESDTDVYNIGYSCLDWLWTQYRKALEIGKPEITPAQLEARQRNMEAARQKRADTKKYLKTHF